MSEIDEKFARWTADVTEIAPPPIAIMHESQFAAMFDLFDDDDTSEEYPDDHDDGRVSDDDDLPHLPSARRYEVRNGGKIRHIHRAGFENALWWDWRRGWKAPSHRGLCHGCRWEPGEEADRCSRERGTARQRQAERRKGIQERRRMNRGLRRVEVGDGFPF